MLKKFLQLFRKKQSLLPLDSSDWMVLIAGIIVFAGVSLWTITKSSIWFDEAFGAYLIQFDFWQIAHYTATDVHPPFFYWLLKVWSVLFGNTELPLRSMSVVFGGVAIFFAFLLAKRSFGRGAAWTSIVFLALAPMFIRYSQEMRMYTLVAAIALAATYTLTIAVESNKRKHWIVYGLLVALGMWTHYFSALVWIAHWIWRSWVVCSETKNLKAWFKAFFSKNWLLAHIVALVVFLPWVPSLISQVRTVQVGGFWIPPVTPMTLPNFMTNVFYYQNQELVTPWLTFLFLTIGLSIVALGVRTFQRLDKSTQQNYALIGATAFVPIITLVVLSMPPLRSAFIERYLIPSTLAIALFIGVTLALSKQIAKIRWAWVAGTLVVGAFVFGIYNVTYYGNFNKNFNNSTHTRQVIEKLSEKANPGEPIIADSPWLFYEAVFYSTANHPVYFIDAKTEYIYGSLDMLKYNDQHKIKDLRAFSDQHPVVWYVGRPGMDPFISPDPSWKELQHISYDDQITHKPAYQAIQFQTH